MVVQRCCTQHLAIMILHPISNGKRIQIHIPVVITLHVQGLLKLTHLDIHTHTLKLEPGKWTQCID